MHKLSFRINSFLAMRNVDKTDMNDDKTEIILRPTNRTTAARF